MMVWCCFCGDVVVFLGGCGCIFVVVFLRFVGGVVVFCGGVVVSLRLCFCVLLVVWLCFAVMFLWLCFCGGAFLARGVGEESCRQVLEKRVGGERCRRVL